LRAHLFGAVPFHPLEKQLLDLVAYTSVALEYTLPLALLWRRTRTVALAVGVGFHALVFWPLSVGTFSTTMITLYLLFVDPQTVHRWVEEMVGRPPPPTSAAPKEAASPSGRTARTPSRTAGT